MFRGKNLLIDFLLKKTHEMTLCQERDVYWICALNLNLHLWNQHKPDNNFHIPLTQDLI